jgi:AcrR family transcriptional regulator
VKKKRTHKPSEERSADILRVASRLFAEHGYRSLDVQDVADGAGVGKGTVYRCFPSKEALFLAALQLNLDDLRNQVDAAASEHADPLEQLTAGMRAYVTFFEQRPEVVELFIQERAEFRDQQVPLYFANRDRHRQRWLHIFQQLAQSGQLATEDVNAAFEMLGCLLYGFALSRNLHDMDLSSDQFEHIFRFFLRGVLNA